MAEYKLGKGRTALLLADFHTDSLDHNPLVKERRMLEHARDVLDAARKAGVFVVYAVLNFRPGYPEVAGRNKWAMRWKTSGEHVVENPSGLIHPAVAPQPGEPVVAKHRSNPFFGSDLEMILKAQNVDTLVLMGHSTSGVILSTVRYAADADYQLIVVEDGCADRSPENHDMLMDRVLSKQAHIVSAAEIMKAFAAL